MESWLWGMMGVTCGSTPRTWVPAFAGKTIGGLVVWPGCF